MGMFDFGRKFLNSLPLTGGITSALWGDPNQEAHQKSFEQVQEDLKRQRYDMMGGRMNAMNQGAMAFGPRNQMLGEMMGKGPGQDAMNLQPMLQNPMPAGMQNRIREDAFGGKPPPAPQGAFSGSGPQNPYRRY